MKVILLCALIGLSFYQASGNEGPSTTDPEKHTCKTSPVPYSSFKNCLAQALRESAELLKDIGEFLCEYQACQKGDDSCNYENFKKTLTTFIYAAACFGCQVDKILGEGHTFEDVLTKISGSKFQVGEFVEKLAESMGIAKPLADLLCLVAGRLLQSKCVQDALAKLAPSAVQDLAVLYCKDDSEKEIAENLAGILKNTECTDVKLLGTEDELGDLLGSLGDTLSPVVRSVLITTQQFPVVDDSFCTLLNGILEKGGLVSGLLGRK